MSVRISRQHWDGLLAELDQARRVHAGALGRMAAESTPA